MSDLDVLLEKLEHLANYVGQSSRELADSMRRVNDAVAQLGAVRSSPPPQWEAIALAMKTRHKSRAALLAAIKAGHIEHRRTNAGNDKAGYLLSVADLDRHFPRVAKKTRTPKQKATA